MNLNTHTPTCPPLEKKWKNNQQALDMTTNQQTNRHDWKHDLLRTDSNLHQVFGGNHYLRQAISVVILYLLLFTIPHQLDRRGFFYHHSHVWTNCSYVTTFQPNTNTKTGENNLWSLQQPTSDCKDRTPPPCSLSSPLSSSHVSHQKTDGSLSNLGIYCFIGF